MKRGAPGAKLDLGSVAALRATADSLPVVCACVEGAFDYFKRAEGARRADQEAASRLYEALADRKRRLFTLWRLDRPIGLLELALDAPVPGEVTVVLLTLIQAERGNGLGREIAQALFGRLAGFGYRAVRLGVAPGEAQAAEFWRSLGMWEAGDRRHGRLFELPLR